MLPRRFFTADLHFGHKTIIKFGRSEFKDVNEHDDAVVDSINSKVNRADELYILGDVAWSAESLNRARPKIICRHIKVVMGNHDNKGLLTRVFGSAPDTITLKGFGTKNEVVFMSHYPHAFWPSSHYGSYHLYGHMHTQRERWLDEKLGLNRRSIDVGLDNAKFWLKGYVPFSQDELLAIFSGREGHDNIEYYRSLDKLRGAESRPGVASGKEQE